MDRTLKFLYKTLNFFGFDQFYLEPTQKYSLYVRRAFILGITGLLDLTCIWCSIDKNSTFSDRVFLLPFVFGLLSVNWQYWTVWTRANDFVKLFDWVARLHKTNQNEVVEKIASPEYVRLQDLSWKLIRFELF